MAEKEIIAPGYMTFREAAIMLTLMSEKDIAAATKATATYFLYGTETQLEGVAAQVFAIMKSDIDKGNEHYKKTVIRNRENGKKGGRPHKNPVGTQWKPTRKLTQTQTQTKTETQAESQSVKTGIIPKLEEVKAFCTEQGIEIDPTDFYETMVKNGWKDYRGNPVESWKAVLVSWERKRQKDKAKHEYHEEPEHPPGWNPFNEWGED